MVKSFLSNRLLVLYIIPFILGLLSTLSFEPFNLTIINFIIFKFVSRGKNYVIGKSNESFVLKNKKGLNIPHSIYDNKFQERVYFKFLKKIS